MPINNFSNDTFVAFLDISGFKELMKRDDKAWKALDRLYQYGYEVLQNQNNLYQVKGIFISDCGVLFVRKNEQDDNTVIECLKSLLKTVKKINELMRSQDYMLTTSIAFGKFTYHNRIEFDGIDKNLVYGHAYLSAFLDTEIGKPKIQPGQCRIVKDKLHPQIIDTLNNVNNSENDYTDEIFEMIKERKNDKKHYYFYWMVDNPEQVDEFEKEYCDAYKLKYAGMLSALKRYYVT